VPTALVVVVFLCFFGEKGKIPSLGICDNFIGLRLKYALKRDWGLASNFRRIVGSG
jgi:hypothetical protein